MPTKTLTAGQTFDKYSISLADLKALGANTSGSIVLTSLPAGTIVTHVFLKHSTALVGPSLSAATARVNANSKNFATAYDVFAAVSATAFDYDDEAQFIKYDGAANLQVTITLTGANANALTAGAIDVYVETIPMF
jgi:hypothetical protein